MESTGDTFKMALLKSLVHGFEIVAVGLVFVFIYLQVSDDPEVKKALANLVISVVGIGISSILPAFLRKWKDSGVTDYVNDL